MNPANVLAACDLFDGLSEKDLACLSSACSVRRLDQGEALFHQGAKAAGFYILASGSLSVLRTGGDGRQQILHLIAPGEAVGEVAVFEGRDFPATAVAEKPSLVVFLPRDRFRDAARQHPDMLLNMLATLSARLRRFVSLVDDLALKDVGARLARYLLENCDDADEVLLQTSKSTLAARLGTISETLSRTLRKLQHRGDISVDGPKIHVHNRTALEDLCDEGRLK